MRHLVAIAETRRDILFGHGKTETRRGRPHAGGHGREIIIRNPCIWIERAGPGAFAPWATGDHANARFLAGLAVAMRAWRIELGVTGPTFVIAAYLRNLGQRGRSIGLAAIHAWMAALMLCK